MKIETLKDLRLLIKECRKQGVDIIKVDGVELVLGQMPNTPKGISNKYTRESIHKAKESILAGIQDPTADNALIDTPDELTEEQLLFYSTAQMAVEQQ